MPYAGNVHLCMLQLFGTPFNTKSIEIAMSMSSFSKGHDRKVFSKFSAFLGVLKKAFIAEVKKMAAILNTV